VSFLDTQKLDRLAHLGMTAAREEEMGQLVNDLAEKTNLRHWKRADFIECIKWQQRLLFDANCAHNHTYFKILDALTRS